METAIIQTSSALDRLLGRPVFDGPVEAGKRYVLVDDVTVMGGTLSELANHIRAGGGEVAEAVTLVNASRSNIKGAPRQHIRLVEARYGDIVREEFGIDPAALTGDEAVVILNARDADTLRDRIAATKGERERRLLRQGVREGDTEGRLTTGAAAQLPFPRRTPPQYSTSSATSPACQTRCSHVASPCRMVHRGGAWALP